MGASNKPEETSCFCVGAGAEPEHLGTPSLLPAACFSLASELPTLAGTGRTELWHRESLELHWRHKCALVGPGSAAQAFGYVLKGSAFFYLISRIVFNLGA